MGNFLNFGILKSPRNIAIIILFVALWYFGAFAAAGRMLKSRSANDAQ